MRQESCELLIGIFASQIDYLESAIEHVKDITEKEEDKFSLYKSVLDTVNGCRLNFKSAEKTLREYEKLQGIEIAWRKKLNGVVEMSINGGNGNEKEKAEIEIS